MPESNLFTTKEMALDSFILAKMALHQDAIEKAFHQISVQLVLLKMHWRLLGQGVPGMLSYA